MLTQERLKELLHYDPDTGVFTWRVNLRRKNVKGTVAGGARRDGYGRIGIGGKRYLSHRLAWLYVYGVWPKNLIDHKDRNQRNNAISNLRDVTHKENSENTTDTSEHRGVSWCRGARRWQARIQHFGKQVYLGLFNTVEEAQAVYLTAREEMFTPVVFGAFMENKNGD